MATDLLPIKGELTWESLRSGVHELCKARGWHHGVPIVSIFDQDRKIVLAKGCPLADKHGHDVPVSMNGVPEVRVCSTSDVDEQDDSPMVVNVWTTRPKTIAVAKHSKGAIVEKFVTTNERLDMYITSMICQAGAVKPVAEWKAMGALLRRLNEVQHDSYILAGAFLEKSKRSGVMYCLRKGLPTLALKPEKKADKVYFHFLAALCSHCLGWYQGTHVGVYPPSDQVLADLLAIRADEHDFWKRAQQHTLDDPMSAI
jgi:hypothetical protein